jgi:transcriptional regulator with XRE-family HTH domain
MEKSTFTTDHRVLCRLLKRSREQAQMTQVELGRRLGKSQSEISKCERGETRLDLVQLRRWCRALGLDLLAFVKQFEESLPRRR